METCVDISLYPLKEDYRPLILDFIKQLHRYDQIRVETNSMSTQICGPYELVFELLKTGIRDSFEKTGDQVFVVKILKIGDEPNKQ